MKQMIDRHRGKSPEAVIEAHAEKLRRRAQQHTLPIKVDLVASVARVKQRVAPYDFAGRIYVEPNGQLVMDLNENNGTNRQRFTAAHELMHPAFPNFKEEKRYRLDALAAGASPPNKEEEWLCDHGAAALLMPPELVAGRYLPSDGLAAVEQLARDAEVSLEAAGNRIVSLSDEPVVFLCLALTHKPADRPGLRKGHDVPKRLRVRYGSTAHLDIYLPRFKSAEPDSALCRAHGSWKAARAVEALPGADAAGMFRVEAKRYGADDMERVLAIARPTA